MQKESHQSIYHQKPEKHHAIIIVNLGSPKELTTRSIAKFLREFLSDHRVIKIPKLFWYPILYGIILPFRSKRLVHNYGSIWDNGSPLLNHTHELAEKMDNLAPEHVHVRAAMNYGSPSIEQTIKDLRKEHPIRDITILPLYPQYSASTSASVFDRLAKWGIKDNFIPNLRFISSYHDHATWLDMIIEQIRTHRENNPGSTHLFISYHGLPADSLSQGDPYYCLCTQTTRLLAERLGLNEDEISMGFQSRFGYNKWLEPYTDDVLDKLAKSHEVIDVICPGFATDCLETLEEIKITYGELFKESGGKDLRYIDCANSSELHAKTLLSICLS